VHGDGLAGGDEPLRREGLEVELVGERLEEPRQRRLAAEIAVPRIPRGAFIL
jgi:hypothetical protein